jgi:hypothetical protein
LKVRSYTPNFNEWQDKLKRLVDGETENVAVNRLVVGDPYFYQGQIPIISEWGGFT